MILRASRASGRRGMVILRIYWRRPRLAATFPDEYCGRVSAAAVSDLAALMRGKRVLGLSGAGMSTESGIPDYRGPTSTLRRAQPMSYQEFVRNPAGRVRYWARSAVGWPRVSSARPNAGHAALACMESAGAVFGVIEQNVDSV